MMRVAVLGCLLAATGACTGFERSSSPVAPTATGSSPTPSPEPPAPGGGSLIGTWSSSPLSGISAASCTGFSWQVTSQTPTSLSGTFSATCANGLSATGTAAGQIDGSQVPYTIVGAITAPGFPPCPVTIGGTAQIVDSNTLRVPYDGTTCLGPVSGEETLRRPSASTPGDTGPTETSPAETTPQPGGESPYHVGPGPASMGRAEQVVRATADEYAVLRLPRGSESEAAAASTELLRRMIWHLRHAGFDAGRQKNPSGAISGDKLTVLADGGWHAVDVFQDYGAAGIPVQVIFLEVFPASPVADEGIPD